MKVNSISVQKYYYSISVPSSVIEWRKSGCRKKFCNYCHPLARSKWGDTAELESRNIKHNLQEWLLLMQRMNGWLPCPRWPGECNLWAAVCWGRERKPHNHSPMITSCVSLAKNCYKVHCIRTTTTTASSSSSSSYSSYPTKTAVNSGSHWRSTIRYQSMKCLWLINETLFCFSVRICVFLFWFPQYLLRPPLGIADIGAGRQAASERRGELMNFDLLGWKLDKVRVFICL